MTIAPESSRIPAATEAPRAKRTQHRQNENLRPRLIAGGAGKLGRGLAQPSDNPTLRLPDVILAFSEWQLKQASHLARMEVSSRGRRGGEEPSLWARSALKAPVLRSRSVPITTKVDSVKHFVFSHVLLRPER
jgi:hypothetical protein